MQLFTCPTELRLSILSSYLCLLSNPHRCSKSLKKPTMSNLPRKAWGLPTQNTLVKKSLNERCWSNTTMLAHRSQQQGQMRRKKYRAIEAGTEATSALAIEKASTTPPSNARHVFTALNALKPRTYPLNLCNQTMSTARIYPRKDLTNTKRSSSPELSLKSKLHTREFHPHPNSETDWARALNPNLVPSRPSLPH